MGLAEEGVAQVPQGKPGCLNPAAAGAGGLSRPLVTQLSDSGTFNQEQQL